MTILLPVSSYTPCNSYKWGLGWWDLTFWFLDQDDPSAAFCWDIRPGRGQGRIAPAVIFPARWALVKIVKGLGGFVALGALRSTWKIRTRSRCPLGLFRTNFLTTSSQKANQSDPLQLICWIKEFAIGMTNGLTGCSLVRSTQANT